MLALGLQMWTKLKVDAQEIGQDVLWLPIKYE
jgi:hypothetical protein